MLEKIYEMLTAMEKNVDNLDGRVTLLESNWEGKIHILGIYDISRCNRRFL